MDTLSADNIFTDEEVGRILGEITAESESEDQVQENQEEDVVVEDLEDEFSQHPESVGNENEPPAQQPGSPTPNNLFNSIAAALREEGVFPDLDDDELDGVKDARSFRELIDKQINAGLDARQQRINAALNMGVQPSEIQQYEGAIAYLDSVNDDMLSSNTAEGEELRKRIIYQDLLNRGYSHEKAQKEIRKSLNAGTDIEDAKDAYQANQQFFRSKYNALLNEAKAKQEQEKQFVNNRIEQFKKDILESKKVFGNVDIDNDTRRRVLDVITKPTRKGEDGKYYTELQYEQRQDADRFARNVGLLYVLTDGFKNVDKLINQEVTKRTSKGLADLERVLNDTQRNPDGSLNLKSGVSSESNFLLGDFELDV